MGRKAQLAGWKAWASATHASPELDEPKRIFGLGEWRWAFSHTLERVAALGVEDALANLLEATLDYAPIAWGHRVRIQRTLADAGHCLTRRGWIIVLVVSDHEFFIVFGLREADVDNGWLALFGALERVTAIGFERTFGCYHLAILRNAPNAWWRARAIIREALRNISELVCAINTNEGRSAFGLTFERFATSPIEGTLSQLREAILGDAPIARAHRLRVNRALTDARHHLGKRIASRTEICF